MVIKKVSESVTGISSLKKKKINNFFSLKIKKNYYQVPFSQLREKNVREAVGMPKIKELDDVIKANKGRGKTKLPASSSVEISEYPTWTQAPSPPKLF